MRFFSTGIELAIKRIVAHPRTPPLTLLAFIAFVLGAGVVQAAHVPGFSPSRFFELLDKESSVSIEIGPSDRKDEYHSIHVPGDDYAVRYDFPAELVAHAEQTSAELKQKIFGDFHLIAPIRIAYELIVELDPSIEPHDYSSWIQSLRSRSRGYRVSVIPDGETLEKIRAQLHYGFMDGAYRSYSMFDLDGNPVTRPLSPCAVSLSKPLPPGVKFRDFGPPQLGP